MAVRESGKNQVIAKQENISLIKSLIYKEGPISRAEIAARLQLTPPTITNIIGEMIQEGIICETSTVRAAGERKAGRTPICIDYVSASRLTIGISLGRDYTHFCICDLRGNMIEQGQQPVMMEEYDQMYAELKKLIQKLIRKCGKSKSRLIGIGIAVPGIVEAHQGVITKTDRHRQSWEKQPLAESLQEEFQVPVRVENNVRARTMMLSLFRPDVVADFETFILCYASWGIAGPMTLQNRSVRGEYGAAGEIGHMVMNPETGETLEEFASLKYVLSRCRQAMADGKVPYLSKICGNPEDLTIEMIQEAQGYGEEEVVQIMETAMRYIGIALSNLISFTNPDLIILSGPMFHLESNRALTEKIMRQHAYSADIDHTAVRYIVFDDYSGAQAAAAACMEKYFIR